MMRAQVVGLTTILLVGFLGLSPSHAQPGVDILLNGDFEEGPSMPLNTWAAGTWNVYGGHTVAVVSELVGAAVPEPPVEGKYCLHVTVPAAGANFWDVGVKYPGLVFEQGKKYTLSVFLKCKSGTLQANLKPELDGDPYTGYGEQQVTMTDTWAEYSLTTPVFTTTVTPAALTFHVAYTAGEFWVDGVRWYEGDYVPPAFRKRVEADDPSPENGAVDVPRDVVLGWQPGPYAATHDVYFGTSFDDVNDAGVASPRGVLVSQGQTTTTFAPTELLEFGQTYYWRVDEVNAPPDSTVFKGDVWSFTVEPYVYPIRNITATASSAQADNRPENTVNGSGLNPQDQHSNNELDMWLSTGDQPNWIQFEFDQVYKLHELWVWNYNQGFELFVGWGAKEVTIEYSADGETWTELEDVPEFAQATGMPTYTHGTTVSFDGVFARFVKLTITKNWGTMVQTGLSEVRFFYLPIHAREPQPADGATGVAIDTDLIWRPGREAQSHTVYLGKDQDAVAGGTVAAVTRTQRSYTPPALDLGTTYFWRVDEVGDTGTFEGNLWSFTTQEFLVVDDFESYDDDNNRIYLVWIDGEENKTGSTVGYMESVGGTFGERTIVHGGRQAMPIFYDNAGLTTAEAQRTLDAQDWTARGIKSLSLFFRGAPENTGQLYVKINNTKVVYDGDAADIKRPTWQVWNIDLSAVAGNLSQVTQLTIGIEGAGASGTLYIDDIRLYPRSPQFVVPAEPDTANLVAYYAFDGNANDGSGKGRHGTVQGTVSYVAGVTGQAINLDGTAAHVTVATVGITGAASRTISGWAKADRTTIPEWTNVFGFTGADSNGQHFDIQAVGTTATTTLGYYGLHRYGWEQNILPIDLEWHHLAATLDGTTVTWYGDGIAMGSDQVTNVNTPGPFHVGKRQDNTNFFPGSVDEVRVYDRALSAEEIAWLAGKRTPAHKPF
jgi:hypothetical protein